MKITAPILLAFLLFTCLVGCVAHQYSDPAPLRPAQPELQAPVPPPPQPKSPAPTKPRLNEGAWYRYDLNDEELAAATATAKQKLKEPDTAIVRELKRHSRGMNDDYVCGELNAKGPNGGGYAGFKRFYITSKNAIIFEDDKIVGYLVNRLCSSPDAPVASKQKKQV
ncbi:MAG: hypothetical protein JWM78_2752 [Verrucomicrobiaceae bacterium]|nr:hypothetical protein [Verrucomicrobiaceae bacterium]